MPTCLRVERFCSCATGVGVGVTGGGVDGPGVGVGVGVGARVQPLPVDRRHHENLPVSDQGGKTDRELFRANSCIGAERVSFAFLQ